MSDLERYCSSYYDKHGLYNDGFPCPEDTYCCQSSADQTKMCCSLSSLSTQTLTISSSTTRLIKQMLNHQKSSHNSSISSYSSKPAINNPQSERSHLILNGRNSGNTREMNRPLLNAPGSLVLATSGSSSTASVFSYFITK